MSLSLDALCFKSPQECSLCQRTRPTLDVGTWNQTPYTAQLVPWSRHHTCCLVDTLTMPSDSRMSPHTSMYSLLSLGWGGAQGFLTSLGSDTLPLKAVSVWGQRDSIVGSSG